MHRLQQLVFYRLIKNSKLRYAGLKPKNVEGNLFTYHLKKLMDAGYVRKRKDGHYELTGQGKHFADGISLKSFQPRIQPKIVTLIVCKNDKGEHLLYKRKRQPFIGRSGFPYGKIHLGETLIAAAEREFAEKTGLSAKLKHVGDAYVTTFEDEELVSQMLAHILKASSYKGTLRKRSSIGDCFWAKPSRFSEDEVMPGFRRLLHLVENSKNERFFEELIIKI